MSSPQFSSNRHNFIRKYLQIETEVITYGKNKKEKPELTLENLNRAIRTYQREEVLYLIQHGILKDPPEDEKTATYQQLASLQNMEILQSVAKQENFLDPEIFCNQSDSSVIKNV